jgi:hypothetical protein
VITMNAAAMATGVLSTLLRATRFGSDLLGE